MSLETGNTIASLNSSNPVVGDPVSQGDDHLRLIKTVLKNIFPGSGGLGFSIPITASEAELNYVDGVTSAIQTQLNTLATNVEAVIPNGTVMPFFQAAAPVGWTKVTTHNNKMLRVVSGAGGGNGGTDSPILMDKVPSHTHPFTTGANNVDHTHNFNAPTALVSVAAGSNYLEVWNHVSGVQATGANSVDHSHSGTTSANSAADTWSPLYIDVIICSKN